MKLDNRTKSVCFRGYFKCFAPKTCLPYKHIHTTAHCSSRTIQWLHEDKIGGQMISFYDI